MNRDRVKLYDSLTGHLLKIIIGGYLIVTITTTLIQLSAEYYHVKKTILQEVQKLEKTFGPGIADALWIYNFEALKSILIGMNELSIVTGVVIKNESLTTVQYIGMITDNDGKLIILNPNDKPTLIDEVQSRFSNMFIYEFPIKFVDLKGVDQKLGKCIIYSSSDIVLNRIEYGFLLILISTVVKTTALCIIFVFFVLRILGKPLGKLASDIEHVNLDNLEHISINVETSGQNELKVLEKTFNAMIQKLIVAKKNLHDYAEKYRNIFENAIEGIFQTGTDDRLINANPAMAKILGYNAPEELIVIDKSIFHQCFVSPEDIKQFSKTLDKEGQITDFEGLGCRKDGSQFWGSMSVRTIFNDTNNKPFYEGSFTDITTRKQKEKAERKREAAEASTKSKSEFLANMSHEIRTPMNAIIGLSGLALKTKMTAKQRDYLNKIENAGQSLLGLINDILDFSKIEAGKLDVEPIEFSLNGILDNISNLISIKAEEKGIEILFDVDSRVPYDLVGDPLRLGQVLINLANNAVKFTRKGHVIVKITRLDESDMNTADHVILQFEVQDTGIGLTREQINNLFQPFRQADSSTTRQYGGTGLGLTISKHLVEIMGGRIWIESKPDKGSTFFFTARFGFQPEKKESFSQCPVELRGMRVLVVDDNDAAQKILCDMLESFSFRVSSADSGMKALKMLNNHPTKDPYKLILMDWKMPVLDGIETSKQIKKNSNLSHIPAILMVTAYSREEVKKQAEASGIDAFLIKPVNPSLLYNATMEIFSKAVKGKSNILEEGFEDLETLKQIRGAKILLVEDNEINQQVATELLESQGLIVTVANNGLEALEQIKKTTPDTIYELVLMDLQMPEMDGYTATREIRKWEETPVPIIAITAHAMAGEKDKCLAAGMNDYVSKPIDPAYLYSTILKYVKPGERNPVAASEMENTVSPGEDKIELPVHLSGIDIKTGLRHVSGNKALYLKLLIQFQKKYADTGQEIKDALEKSDIEMALRLVHTVKGVSGIIGAEDLYQSADGLGQSLKQENRDTLPLFLERFEATLAQVIDGVCGLESMQEEEKTVSISTKEIPLDIEKVISLIKDLPKLLESNYIKAIDRLNVLREHLSNSSVREEFKQVEKHVEEFDFEEASAGLEKIVKTLK